MSDLFLALFRSLLSGCRSRPRLVLEHPAFRHQLAVLKRNTKQPKLRSTDRLLWVALQHFWAGWQQALAIVRPQAGIAWQRLGFRLFWRWKSRPRGGRPPVEQQLIGLIRRMWQANPTWGSPRIQAELAKLGIQVSDSTVR